MPVSLRATLSVLLLAGFYVVALGVIAALGVLAALAFSHGLGSAGVKFAIAAVVVAVALVGALWKVARAKPDADPGVEVTRAQAPELWDMVDALAAEVGTRGPEKILLVSDVNAAVAEDARFLGLAGGTRRLYLGVPLLLGLDAAQLRAVIGHELGHYSGSHTRLGPIAHRGIHTMGATLAQLHGPTRWALLQYANLYVLVSKAVGRAQELEADRVMASVAGPATAQAALRELPALSAVWAFYVNSYATIGWDVGLAPTAEEFYAGFAEVMVGRADEVARLRAEAPPSDRSRWDSHPPVAERLERLAALPAGPSAAPDPRPAWALLPGFADLAAATAQALVAFGDRERVSYPELVARTLAVGDQDAADAVYRVVARQAGTATATLETALTLAAAGRLTEVARELVPDAAADDLGHVTQRLCLTLLRSATVQAGAASWRLSWSGPAEVTLRDGRPLDLHALAEYLAATAIDHPAARVQQVRDYLQALGVDPARVGQVETQATARRAQIVGGVADVKVDGVAHDLLVLDVGLVLAVRERAALAVRVVANQTGSSEGTRRLVALARSASVEELARTHRFIAFEDLAHVTLDGKLVLKAMLHLHDGTAVALRVSVTADQLGKEDLPDLIRFLAPYTRAAAPVPPGA